MKSGNIFRLIIGMLVLISGVMFITMNHGEPVIGSFLIFGGLAFLHRMRLPSRSWCSPFLTCSTSYIFSGKGI
jgi:hypothetical protein